MIAPTSVASRMRARRSFDKSPMLVFYEMTQACDLVCLHCRACAKPERDPAELTTAESKQMFDQLAQFPEPPMLILTGGDPLKRADIFELIEYGISIGLSISITPSATPLMTREAIQRLKDSGISRMAVSVDGSDASTHEKMRGVVGSFQRALDILSDARDIGLETQVNTTITPANVDQIESMGDLFADLGIAMWSAFFLIPVGRADQMEKLNADECEAAFERLWAQSKKQPYIVKTTEAMHFRRFAIQNRPSKNAQNSSGCDEDTHRPFIPMGVNDGKGVMFVSHAGIVHPSGFLPVVCGVFPHQSVVKIYQDSPIMKNLRDSDLLEGKCGRCEFRNICGGSRARAYAMTGNLFAEEPDCCYIPPEK